MQLPQRHDVAIVVLGSHIIRFGECRSLQHSRVVEFRGPLLVALDQGYNCLLSIFIVIVDLKTSEGQAHCYLSKAGSIAYIMHAGTCYCDF